MKVHERAAVSSEERCEQMSEPRHPFLPRSLLVPFFLVKNDRAFLVVLKHVHHLHGGGMVKDEKLLMNGREDYLRNLSKAILILPLNKVEYENFLE